MLNIIVVSDVKLNGDDALSRMVMTAKCGGNRTQMLGEFRDPCCLILAEQKFVPIIQLHMRKADRSLIATSKQKFGGKIPNSALYTATSIETQPALQTADVEQKFQNMWYQGADGGTNP
ncbi:hypothetical protein DFH09DRAFT_1096232 [Mycena vulgaris]|nr:hypothetical protein DFH09DRAFT_1096232 [Mycena vulgaris]